MHESCTDGLTSHSDLESCTDVRTGVLDAVTEAGTGWIASRDRVERRGADVVAGAGRPRPGPRRPERSPAPARAKTPRTFRQTGHGTLEALGLWFGLALVACSPTTDYLRVPWPGIVEAVEPGTGRFPLAYAACFDMQKVGEFWDEYALPKALKEKALAILNEDMKGHLYKPITQGQDQHGYKLGGWPEVTKGDAPACDDTKRGPSGQHGDNRSDERTSRHTLETQLTWAHLLALEDLILAHNALIELDRTEDELGAIWGKDGQVWGREDAKPKLCSNTQQRTDCQEAKVSKGALLERVKERARATLSCALLTKRGLWLVPPFLPPDWLLRFPSLQSWCSDRWPYDTVIPITIPRPIGKSIHGDTISLSHFVLPPHPVLPDRESAQGGDTPGDRNKANPDPLPSQPRSQSPTPEHCPRGSLSVDPGQKFCEEWAVDWVISAVVNSVSPDDRLEYLDAYLSFPVMPQMRNGAVSLERTFLKNLRARVRARPSATQAAMLAADVDAAFHALHVRINDVAPLKTETEKVDLGRETIQSQLGSGPATIVAGGVSVEQQRKIQEELAKRTVWLHPTRRLIRMTQRGLREVALAGSYPVRLQIHVPTTTLYVLDYASSPGGDTLRLDDVHQPLYSTIKAFGVVIGTVRVALPYTHWWSQLLNALQKEPDGLAVTEIHGPHPVEIFLNPRHVAVLTLEELRSVAGGAGTEPAPPASSDTPVYVGLYSTLPLVTDQKATFRTMQAELEFLGAIRTGRLALYQRPVQNGKAWWYAVVRCTEVPRPGGGDKPAAGEIWLGQFNKDGAVVPFDGTQPTLLGPQVGTCADPFPGQ